jgi:hypothetical protein
VSESLHGAWSAEQVALVLLNMQLALDGVPAEYRSNIVTDDEPAVLQSVMLTMARLSRAISEADARITGFLDACTETSVHLIRAGIMSFGWNWEGVDKLAAKLAAADAYARRLQTALAISTSVLAGEDRTRAEVIVAENRALLLEVLSSWPVTGENK